MENEHKTKFYTGNPNTGEPKYIGEGSAVLTQDGEKWEIKAEVTTTKTQGVLMLLQFVADNGQGEHSEQASRALSVINKNLASFEIVAKENPGEGVDLFWNVKAGVRQTTADKAVKEVLDLPIVKAAILRVFPDAGKAPGGEIVKGGGGVRVGAHWGKTRFEVKKQKKEKRKASPEDMPFEFTLLKLLRDYSTHRDKEHELYLLGNGGEEFEEVAAALEGENKTFSEFQRVAVMEIPQTELYKAYTGKPSAAISRDERRRIDKLLETFQSDIVTAIIKDRQPNKTVKWYEMSGPKITVARVATLTEEEAAIREAGGELPEAKTVLKIRFHPAFTFDIREKYGLLPDDYLQRMKKAIGGGRSGSKYWLLIDYLNGIRGHGKASGYETALDFDTAALLLDLERFKKKQGIPATAAEIEEAIRVAQEVGLVLSWSKEPGARQQRQYQFKLNPEFGR